MNAEEKWITQQLLRLRFLHSKTFPIPVLVFEKSFHTTLMYIIKLFQSNLPTFSDNAGVSVQ